MSKASSAYARATFAHASSSDQLESWYNKMQLIQDIRHPALKNPFSTQDVVNCLIDVLTLSDSQAQWLHALQQDKCLHLLGKIAVQFVALYQNANQIIPVTLVTARLLTEQEQTQFKQTLSKIFKHQITTQFTVRPDIIGGVQLEYDGKLVDLSYAKILNQLHTRK